MRIIITITHAPTGPTVSDTVGVDVGTCPERVTSVERPR